MIIRTAIFDNNRNIQNIIIGLLEKDPVFEVVGCFSDTGNCVQQVILCKPDVVIIDIEMAGAKGINIISSLTKETPQVQILIQTANEDSKVVFESFCAGASGFILKNHIKRYLIQALKDLRMGGAPMSPSIATKVLKLLRREHRKGLAAQEPSLTATELNILKGIKNGQSYTVIGADMGISFHTVRTHIKKIHEKLNVDSNTEAVAKALHQQLI